VASLLLVDDGELAAADRVVADVAAVDLPLVVLLIVPSTATPQPPG
jgi:hypothetical protein